MFNTMTSQFYEWLSPPWKKHAVTIGCLGHMLKSAELACDMWQVKQPMVTACFFMEDLTHS